MLPRQSCFYLLFPVEQLLLICHFVVKVSVSHFWCTQRQSRSGNPETRRFQGIQRRWSRKSGPRMAWNAMGTPFTCFYPSNSTIYLSSDEKTNKMVCQMQPTVSCSWWPLKWRLIVISNLQDGLNTPISSCASVYYIVESCTLHSKRFQNEVSCMIGCAALAN